jgi:hypothetical protein
MNSAQTVERYNRNLAILRRRFPMAAVAVASAPDTVELVPSKKGPLTGRAGKISIHSFHDPVMEAQKFVASQGVSSGSHVALFGIGLGHHLAPLLAIIGNGGRVVAVEANASILKAALRVIENPAVLEDPRLTLVAGVDEERFLEELSAAFAGLDADRTKTIIFNPSFQLIPPGFTRTRTAIEMVRMERKFPFIMGGIEAENLRKNLARLRSANGINSLRGIAKGRGAFIVGAGPSLDRDVITLSAPNGCVIISTDTALPVLLNAGVAPHFVVTADPQAESLRHFSLAGRFDLPLILTPTASADILEKWTGPVYAGFIRTDRLTDEALRMADTMGTFKSGGTVSALAFEAAIIMGADPVILVGQDFGWPGGRCYAQGTYPEQAGADYMTMPEIIYEENHFGQRIPTSVSLHSYRRSFEWVAQTTGARVFTLSTWGLPAKGVAPISSPLEVVPGGISVFRFPFAG